MNYDHRDRLIAVEDRTASGALVNHVVYGYDAQDQLVYREVKQQNGVAGSQAARSLPSCHRATRRGRGRTGVA